MNLPLVCGLGFAVFSAWLLIYAVRSYRKGLASSDWPTATGRLTKIELWGKRNIKGEMRDAENLSVEYSFEVAGRRYTGLKATFYTLAYPETLEFADQYQEGREVKVSYQPDDPNESVLIPGVRPGSRRFSDITLAIVGLLISATVAILGALGLLG